MTTVPDQKISRRPSNAKPAVELAGPASISTAHSISTEALDPQRQFLLDLLRKQSISETSSASVPQHKISSARSKGNLFCLLPRTISEPELARAQRLISSSTHPSSLRKRSKSSFKSSETTSRKKVRFDPMATVRHTLENETFWQLAASGRSRFLVPDGHQLAVSPIRLSAGDLNGNDGQGTGGNISIEKASGRRKLRRMLPHIGRGVLPLATVGHSKLVQKSGLRINPTKEDCFAKTLQIRHSIRKKMK